MVERCMNWTDQTEVENLHPRMLVAGGYLERHLGLERRRIERDR